MDGWLVISWMDGLMVGWMMKGWLVKLLGGWLIVDIWVRWWMGGLMGWFMYGWVIGWMDGWIDGWMEWFGWLDDWLDECDNPLSRSVRHNFSPFPKSPLWIHKCKQKLNPVWFSCGRKSHPLLCEHSLNPCCTNIHSWQVLQMMHYLTNYKNVKHHHYLLQVIAFS